MHGNLYLAYNVKPVVVEKALVCVDGEVGFRLFLHHGLLVRLL